MWILTHQTIPKSFLLSLFTFLAFFILLFSFRVAVYFLFVFFSQNWNSKWNRKKHTQTINTSAHIFFVTARSVQASNNIIFTHHNHQHQMKCKSLTLSKVDLNAESSFEKSAHFTLTSLSSTLILSPGLSTKCVKRYYLNHLHITVHQKLHSVA